jgi:SnoaL-like domain
VSIDSKRIAALLDKEEIREASLRYTRGIDRHDDELMAQAYHPDATDDHGGYIGSPAGFIQHAGDVHTRHWTVHHHFIANQTIELDGDHAHVETYFLATLRRKDGIIDMVGGRYIDRFERRHGRWAVADRVCLVEWNGELAKSQASIDPDLFVNGTRDRSDPSYQRPLELNRPHRDIRF